jgi:hypothetical protein
MIIAISLNRLYQYVMQVLSVTTDTAHYYRVTYEPLAPITQPTHSNILPHTSYQDHMYSQIMSSDPYATVYQHLFQLPHRININRQHITLAQGSTNFQL